MKESGIPREEIYIVTKVGLNHVQRQASKSQGLI